MSKVTCLNEDDRVVVPEWVTDLESFRRWTDSDEFPEKARVGYLKGEIWVDMSMEQIFSHNQVKVEFTRVLAGLMKVERLGRYFGDGVFLSNVTADLSNQPDGVFVSRETFDRNRVQLVPGQRGGFVELLGIPDIVLEVISDSSVRKDTVDLRTAYWEAGIKEYWLVDARRGGLQFDILRRTARGYTAVRKQDGWVRSAVLDKSFCLTSEKDDLGQEDFTLSVR